VTYQTGGVVNGKHVRGRTYLSPLATGLDDSDGTPSPSTRAVAELFATNWLGPGSSVRGVVWSRPLMGTGEESEEFVRYGSSHDISSFTTANKFAVLRSRRD
jgi:hypothetical protein